MIDKLKTQIITAVKLLLNKGVAILILAILVLRYLTFASDALLPFIEVVYALVLASTIIVVGPLIRLLVFPTAASLAENGKLAELLADNDKPTSTLMHYWFATFISYTIALLCVSSLL